MESIMAMGGLIVLFMALSFVFAALGGNLPRLGAGLLDGAGQAITLALGMAGAVSLWCGVTEVMRQAGLMNGLARLFSPLLRALFPEAKGDTGLRADLAASVSANLLGLGNAATPLSIRACTRLHEVSGGTGTASGSVCLLVIMSAGSLQLIPSTIAAARLSAGAAAPFDILPAVWFATALSCGVGVGLGLLLERVWGEQP